MGKSSNWQRVNKQRPCPVCERPDWCLFAGDSQNPEAAICARVESSKRCGQAGWLHHLRHDGPTWSPRVRRIEVSAARIGTSAIDFAKVAADFRAALRPDALARLAAALGVSVESLGRLGIGWAARYRAWSFPMLDMAGNVSGIRLRCPGGRKLSVRGGREGLFIPNTLGGGRLLVCEGPTDTAALLDLRFKVVGRPSCTGGVKLLCELVGTDKPAEVVIVADRDEPGQRGAECLAKALVAHCPAVRIIVPPDGIKDAREWKRSGATAADISAAIDAAAVRKLAVRVERKGGTKNGRK
jgi:5S rRNA maturation endonuclease (ribonuclease M5)